MNFFEMFQMLGSNVWFYGIVFIFVLSVLVFVHEWGHYIVARMCGVKVETFSIGFGKELAGFDDKNGTRWKFALIPLGGYVKLFGDTDPASAGHADGVKEGEKIRPFTEAEKKIAFYTQPVWKRAAVVIAGPAVNYLFALLILTALFTFNGQPITPPAGAAVIVGSSADKNGFQPHDRIVSIDGKTITTFEDIRREMMIALNLKKHFIVERDGRMVDIHAAPELLVEEDRFGFEHSRGLLGLISPRHAVRVSDIAAIDGRSYQGDEEALHRALNDRMGKTFTITMQGGDKGQTLRVSPMRDANSAFTDPEAEDYGILYLAGVSEEEIVTYPLPKAFMEALKECWTISRDTFEALGQIVGGTRSASELGGLIRIGALAGDMAQQGVIALILFAALLSINLGLINLFPIPMLDGGHLLFYAIEAAFGRPVPERFQEYAFRVGFTFLIGLMAFANLNDIMQLLL
ncbi:MAG: RIP metalloprotease RseP [Magnetococcus sp. WYHC-3]